MKIQKFNITKNGGKYQDNQGNEKTIWENVGTYTEFIKDDGSINRVVEIPAISLKANVFPVRQKTPDATVEKLEPEVPYEEVEKERLSKITVDKDGNHSDIPF